MSSIEWTSPPAGSTGRIRSKVLTSALAAFWRRNSPYSVALGRAPVVEFEQQAGGEATGDASCHEQIADPGEQLRRIGGGCQALFKGLQLLHVAAAPQGIDQGVFSRPRLGELSAGHRRWR